MSVRWVWRAALRATSASNPRCPRFRASLIVVAGAVIVAACAPGGSAIDTDGDPPAPGLGEPAGPPTWQGAIEESGGVVNVRNPASGLWQGAATPPLRFEPDGSFGGPATGVESIGAALVDRPGNVYLYDSRGHELVALDPDGAVLWRAGREGDGPGEFREPRGAAYDGEETIYVVNQGGIRLDSWRLDGSYAGGIDLVEIGVGRAYMGGFLPPGRLALLADQTYDSATNEYVIVDVDADPPTPGRRFKIGADPMLMMPPGVVLQLSHHFHEDNIFVGNFERYLLRAYDDRGTLQRRVYRDVDYLRRPGFAADAARYTGIAFGGLGAPIVLPGGHWLVVAAWPTNVDDPNAFAESAPRDRPPIEWVSSLDLFDPEGRFLYGVETAGSQTPAIGRPWTVDGVGRLYTVIAEPFPQVRRYRVVIEPPTGLLPEARNR